MNTASRTRQLGEDTLPDLSAPRPAFDSMQPVEIEHAAASSIDAEAFALSEKISAQRARTGILAAGAVGLLALVFIGAAGAVAKTENARAMERVHRHVEAANAALPPAAAIELPSRTVIEVGPAIPETDAIPVNGGTPAWVLMPPGAKQAPAVKKHRRTR